jgi:glycosyltransferase involved in cell wall biosynthesis
MMPNLSKLDHDGTEAPYASLILPIHNQADHLAVVVQGMLAAFAKLDRHCELVLVPNGCHDASVEICERLGQQHPDDVRVVALEHGGWGRAINAGLAVLKANRRVRENYRRKLGSAIYNLECRRLFDLATWDIDGTPKLFPRSFNHLFTIDSAAELYDLELLRRCRYAGYPVVEIPVFNTERFGGRSTTTYRSAARMLWGAYKLSGSDRATARQPRGVELSGRGAVEELAP